MFGFQKPSTLVSCNPRKDKNVLLVSSLHHDDNIGSATGDLKKTEIIILYKDTKGGVDVVDKIYATYNCARNTNHWPMVVFYSIHVSEINAFVIFRGNNPGIVVIF